MNTNNMDKARLFKALFNRAMPQGNSFMKYVPIQMTDQEAREVIAQRKGNLYFDYFKGRAMKIDVGKEVLDTRLYNRDNGQGAAEEAVLKEFAACTPFEI